MGPLRDRASLNRRDLLKLGGLGALSWLLPTPAWSQDSGARPPGKAKALIVLWLDGGPSQLETFDPKSGVIGGGTRAIKTRAKGVQFAAGYEGLADRADKLAVLRSVVTRDGEHQRGRYLLRTGWPLLPTVTYPSLGSVVASELDTDGLEIPRHVSLLSKNPPRGGFLGPDLHAFSVGDPKQPLTDLIPPVGFERTDRRLKDVELLDKAFARGRESRVDYAQHGELVVRARAMMASKQVQAFDHTQEDSATVASYGDTPFGRSCLVARRLVETGVPAVEVSLGGWDSHANNHDVHAKLATVLDQGFSALLDDLAQRNRLDSTLILCCGEFGRTPRINALDGRDHWTRGFSVLMAGGGLRTGLAVGETDPSGLRGPSNPVGVQDIFATVYERLGINRTQVFESDQGRPAPLNRGTPIKQLLA
jgi:hypothetical protein